MNEWNSMPVALSVTTSEEVVAGGAGWTLAAGFAATPFDTALIAECPFGICYLSFGYPGSWNDLQAQWPNATLVRDDKRATALCKMIFSRGRALLDSEVESRLPLCVFVKGTVFQVMVWRALLAIPSGALVSYGDLAKQIGYPTASRAVGTAIGSNPVAYLIPCHRVIRANGAIGGYRWGIARKKAIQAWECAEES